MVEPEREGALRVDGAAEANAAEHREALAALDQEADELEEILVPAHRDPIFGDAAKAGHHPRFERLVERGDIADGVERHALAAARFSRTALGGSGSIFKPSMPTTVWPSLSR